MRARLTNLLFTLFRPSSAKAFLSSRRKIVTCRSSCFPFAITRMALFDFTTLLRARRANRKAQRRKENLKAGLDSHRFLLALTLDRVASSPSQIRPPNQRGQPPSSERVFEW